MVKIISLITLFVFLSLACDAQGVVKHSRTKKTPTPLIEKEYDYVGSFDSGLAEVRYRDLYGWVDSLHNEVIPCKYDRTFPFKNGLSLVALNGKKGFIDRAGNTVVPCIYDDISRRSNGDVFIIGCSDHYYTVTLRYKQGVMDMLGKIILPAIYDKVIFLSDDICCLILAGKSNIINLVTNKVALLPDGYKVDIENLGHASFDNSGYMSEGTIPVVKDKLYGFADTNGKIIVPCIYEAVTFFQHHIASVKKSGKWGCADLNARTVSEPIYDKPFSFPVDIPYAIVQKSEKYGIIDSNGSMIIPCVYDRLEIPAIYTSINGQTDRRLLFAAEQHEKWGIITLKNELLTAYKYDGINAIKDGIVYASYMGKWGAATEDGHIIVPFSYDEIRPFANGIAAVEAGEQYGFCDSGGKEVIPCIYDYASDFNNDTAKVGVKYGIEKYIDKAGHTVRLPAEPGKYSYAGPFYNGLAVVKDEHGFCGYINRDFKEVIPCIYEDAEEFKDSVACVATEGHWIYINTKGDILKSLNDDERLTGQFPVPAKIDGKWGYKDSSGAVVIKPVYDYASYFLDGLACVAHDGKYGSINKTGAEVIPLVYDSPYRFDSGLAMVDSEGSYGFINNNGRAVISLSFDHTRPFMQGLAAAEKNGKWGYINRAGNTVIPFVYQSCGDFHCGLAVVDNGMRGYIDRNGKMVLPMKFSIADDFTKGLACVALASDRSTRVGIIDRTGKMVVPFIYKRAYIYPATNDTSSNDTNRNVIFVYDFWDNQGMLDLKGKMMIPCKYQSISVFSEGLSAVEKDGKWGYVDKNGKEVIFFK